MSLTQGKSQHIHMNTLSPLLLVVREVFDSCKEDDVVEDPQYAQISTATYNEKIPEFQRRFPEFAKTFRRFERSAGWYVSWPEFAEHAVRGTAFSSSEEGGVEAKSTGTHGSVHVLGVLAPLKFGEEHREARVSRTKDPRDPLRCCEVGLSACPPLLPWESCHRVEWRLENLVYNRERQYVSVAGMEISPGRYMSSSPFRAGGISGIFRFWPNGFFNTSQRRERGEGDLGGLVADSWCAIGLFTETRSASLQLRFFVGDRSSSFRNAYFDTGCSVNQIWTPSASEPPEGIEQGLTVGVEILDNTRENALREVPAKCGEKRDSLASKVYMPKIELRFRGSERAELMHASPKLSKHWQVNAQTVTLPREALCRPKPLLKGTGNGGNTKGMSPRLNLAMVFTKNHHP